MYKWRNNSPLKLNFRRIFLEYIWYGAYPFDKNLFEERLSERSEPFKNLEDVRRQFTIYNKGYSPIMAIKISY